MVWFILSLVGAIVLLPVHFLSVEHIKLDAKYGEKRGKQIGNVLGIISGWGYFLFLFGIWLSPQPKIEFPIFDEGILLIGDLFIFSTLDLLIGIIFILPGIWFGIKGVVDLGLETSETHRAEKIVTQGIYASVRHPQYLGAMLSHIGISFLLSQLYAILVTPILVLRDVAACRKEEKELIREFGAEYVEYAKRVPMLIPRFRRGSEKAASQS